MKRNGSHSLAGRKGGTRTRSKHNLLRGSLTLIRRLDMMFIDLFMETVYMAQVNAVLFCYNLSGQGLPISMNAVLQTSLRRLQKEECANADRISYPVLSACHQLIG
jgi:hypothetical protein